ncbi:MAG: ubiquinone/menaquinone biosynthesis methyltransferase [Chloroflexi bacterium]|nr:ubiquinone/menaquinone biosynthesis methyltransferase [Chloroflexota bacterium]
MNPSNDGTKARRVAAMFSRISRRYDFMNTVMTAGRHDRWRRLAARAATEGLAPGLALDVATGTGCLALELARHPEARDVVGVDFVPEMLSLARAKETRHRPTPDVAWALGDALALPFADGAFMCATSGFALRNVSDVRRALGEMARVVRPGGRVAVLEITPLERSGLAARALSLYFRRVVPMLGQWLAGDRDAYTYLPDSVRGFPTCPELARLMEEVGLVKVRWRLLGGGLVALHVGEVR